MKKTPRPHQKAAIKDVVKGFKAHARGKLIMACGTGKTLVANWVREKLKARVTILMAPSNALLAQTLREWKANSARPFAALAVSSDPSVGVDDVAAAEIGTPVSTDPPTIAEFLKGDGQRILLSTYQSSDTVRAAMDDLRVPDVDFLVADEAHRTAGNIERLFPTCVHPTKLRVAKRLFMTATPRFYFTHADGDTVVASMDDEEHFGPVFHELTFAAAIELELLSDYEVHVVFCTTAEAEKLVDDNPQLTLGTRRLRAAALAARIAMLRAMRTHSLNRVITFHSSIASASTTAAELPLVHAWMPARLRTSALYCQTVNCHMDMSARRAVMRDFVATTAASVVTSARCLGEGVDCPVVDGVAFLDPRESRIDIVQAVGRALRLSPNKTRAVIILPVLVTGNAPDQFDGKRFRPVQKVLDALRAHDPTMLDEVDVYAERGAHRGGRTTGRPGGSRLTFDVPVGCDPAIADWFVTRVAQHTPPKAWTAYEKEIRGFIAAGIAPSATAHEHHMAWLKRWRDNSYRLSPRRRRVIQELLPWLPTPVPDRMHARLTGVLKLARDRGYTTKDERLYVASAIHQGETTPTSKSNDPRIAHLLNEIVAIPSAYAWRRRVARDKRASRLCRLLLRGARISQSDRTFIDKQRKRAKTEDPGYAVRAMLDARRQTVAAKTTGKDKVALRARQLQAVETFCAKHGRLPRPGDGVVLHKYHVFRHGLGYGITSALMRRYDALRRKYSRKKYLTNAAIRRKNRDQPPTLNRKAPPNRA